MIEKQNHRNTPTPCDAKFLPSIIGIHFLLFFQYGIPNKIIAHVFLSNYPAIFLYQAYEVEATYLKVLPHFTTIESKLHLTKLINNTSHSDLVQLIDIVGDKLNFIS